MQQRRIVVMDENGRDITNQVVVSADSQKGDSHPVENLFPDMDMVVDSPGLNVEDLPATIEYVDEADLDDLSSSRAASPDY